MNRLAESLSAAANNLHQTVLALQETNRLRRMILDIRLG